MSFRFWRRVRVAPGITLNLSKSAASLSFGPRGAKYTMGTAGTRATAGIPGTGLFYTVQNPGKAKRARGRGAGNSEAPDAPPVPLADRLDLGFFQRLVVPAKEEALVDGWRALTQDEEAEALKQFERAAHLADGAYMAGFLQLKRDALEPAEQHLKRVYEQRKELGRYFKKYEVAPQLSLQITETVTVHLSVDVRGVLLALVEIYQQQGRWKDALARLHDLRRHAPDDPVVMLSAVELLLEAKPGDRAMCQRVVKMTQDVENETPVHTAILLHKARALRELGLHTAARDTLTAALRRRKDRPDELREALWYERALVYEALGRAAQARKDLERVYAGNPNYADVAKRLEMLRASVSLTQSF